MESYDPSDVPTLTQRCPECRDGKHRICTGWAMTPDDLVVDCGCPCTT